jgi:hypothetical protein
MIPGDYKTGEINIYRKNWFPSQPQINAGDPDQSGYMTSTDRHKKDSPVMPSMNYSNNFLLVQRPPVHPVKESDHNILFLTWFLSPVPVIFYRALSIYLSLAVFNSILV